MGHSLSVDRVTEDYKQAVHCYKLMNLPENLIIAESHKDISLVEAFPNVLGETEKKAR
jgi:hypothetical protein